MASASLSRESFNDAVEKALEALKDSSIESLTKYQSKALFHVLNGEDTFVSLPTGHGKSLIYQLAPSVSKHLGLLSEVPIVLVISPLNVLIDDQIASVTKLGITACKLDASSLEDTVSLAGHEILFTSPETDGQTLVAASYYRHVTQKFHGNRISSRACSTEIPNGCVQRSFPQHRNNQNKTRAAKTTKRMAVQC